MSRDLLTTLLLASIVVLLVFYDILASYNGASGWTITEYMRRVDATFPWVKLALAFTIGLLLGHLFLGAPPPK